MNRGDLERLSKDELTDLVLTLQCPAKTSRTSSKPPSTDRKERREQSRPGGANPGREGHNRVMADERTRDGLGRHRPHRQPVHARRMRQRLRRRRLRCYLSGNCSKGIAMPDFGPGNCPFRYPSDPLMYNAWRSFIEWATAKQEFRDAFTNDTGVNADALSDFIEWLNVHHWGEGEVHVQLLPAAEAGTLLTRPEATS